MSCIPDIKTTLRMALAYASGLSLSEVARAFNVTRQSVYTRFARAGVSMRAKKQLPQIIFNGRAYTRRSNGYYARTSDGRAFLHRDVWEANFGTIPQGWDVHHIDEDRSNNSVNNLTVLPKADHTRLHHAKRNAA